MAHGWLRIFGVLFGPTTFNGEENFVSKFKSCVILDQRTLKNLKPKILPFLEQIFDPVSKHNCW